MAPKKTTAAKKIAGPIPKPGATSVDPNAKVKIAIQQNIAESPKSDEIVLVDAKVPNHKDYKVYTKEGTNFSVYLMCADLKNNNNKFYVCQVLENVLDSST